MKLALRPAEAGLDPTLLLKPWRDLGITGRDVNAIPSMITPDESLYLHWLARCRYEGAGEIIDGGPLLGGSTIAMAEGLRRNERVGNKAARIHSYDLFEYHPMMKRRLFKKGPEPAPGDSLLPIFTRNITPWMSSVRVFPGDILRYTWSGAPIEILFIDVAKTWDIQRHLLREFFPHLIPGKSIVVQQDYFFVSCYWIHLIMESLSDYFRPVHMTEGPTLGFEMIAPVPSHLLAIDYERALSKQQALALMDRSIARFEGLKRLVVTTAKVSLLLAHRDIDGAEDVVAQIQRAPEYGDPILQIDVDKAIEKIAKAKAQRAARVA
jgi:hypothetical protein